MRRWEQVRAALIALALVPHLVWALPIPKPVSAATLARPDRQAELRAWGGALRGAGFAVSDDALGAWVVNTTGSLSATHRALKAPFRPLERWLGVDQSWALFASPTATPSRLVVEIERQGRWEVVYRKLSPEHRWADATLRYRRVRGIWDIGDKVSPAYAHLVDTVARWLFERDPTITAVRVSLEQRRIALPGGPAAPPARRRHSETRARP